jgi:hypothetical protein
MTRRPHRRIAVLDRVEHLGDGGVVRGGMGERPARQFEAERPVRCRGVERGQHRRVIRRIDHDIDVGEVLGRPPHHRWTADVDVFDQVIERGRGIGRRARERVQVHGDDIDELDAFPGRRRQVGRVVPARQDPTVHLRVQRLHPAVHHLGKAGHGRHAGDRQPGRRQRRRRSPGRHQFEPAGGQAAGELHHAGLVRHTQQRSPHRSGPVHAAVTGPGESKAKL